MLTTINKEHFDSYIDQYEQLQDFKEPVKLFENENLIILPRLFHINYPDQRINIIENDVTPNNIEFEFTRTLRPLQQECLTDILNIYHNNKYVNGTIKIYPGGGKTVLAICIAQQLKMKTCVIVNSTTLKEQWIGEILSSTNIKPTDIGIIHKNIYDTNHPITIVMIQTLISKYKKNFNDIFKKIVQDNFELVFYDEVHSTSASEKYAKASILFPTKNIIGLSATPFPYGIQDILMRNTIGEIIFDKGDYELIPEYYLIYYNSGLQSFEYINEKTKKSTKLKNIVGRIKDLNMKKAIYNKCILNSNKYIELILKYTKNLYANNYVILILCERVDQVQRIQNELTNIGLPCDTKHGKVNNFNKNTTKILAATTRSCGQGFNMPRISAIIIVSPYSGKISLFQIGGRSLRYGIEGKNNPIILDLIDVDMPSIFLNNLDSKRSKINGEYKGCKIIDYHEKG